MMKMNSAIFLLQRKIVKYANFEAFNSKDKSFYSRVIWEAIDFDYT